MAYYRLFFLPAGVFLNATPSFFRLGEPDLNRNLGLLLLALTNLFQADNLRLGFGLGIDRTPKGSDLSLSS
tara:strand:+ start:2719 stop:2931 length:213 start_codon:yes stop_codon:yes gene_type:complete